MIFWLILYNIFYQLRYTKIIRNHIPSLSLHEIIKSTIDIKDSSKGFYIIEVKSINRIFRSVVSII